MNRPTRTIPLALVPIVALSASIAGAQSGSIEGRVYDSLSHAPLRGATVSVVSATKSSVGANAVTDSAGHYVVPNIAPGDYLVGFYHPLLDSLGIEVPVRRVSITADSRAMATAVNLGVPSVATIHDVVCGRTAPKNDASGLFVGHVREATTGNPAPNGAVTAQWMIITVGRNLFRREVPHAIVHTNGNGWFAYCGLPPDAAISFIATAGADSSSVVSLDVPPGAITRRDLFVAPTHVLAPVDTGGTPDSLRVAMPVIHRGDGVVRGVVRDELSHRPLPGVNVVLLGAGLSAQTDSTGAFRLASLPLGTQTIAVRKLGYLPLEHLVDVVAGDTSVVQLTMPTTQSVLDTVKVNAKRVYAADFNGFLRRRAAGVGRYFDADQIARMNVFRATDVLQRVPSVHLQANGFESVLYMRNVANRGSCIPRIYVDGFEIRELAADELDAMAPTRQITGVEVYDSPGLTPPQFSTGFDRCGTIVVWTDPRSPKRAVAATPP